MTPIFDHIQQAKHLLHQLLESGFLSGRGFEEEFRHCLKAANELGLTAGGDLIGQLSGIITKLRAGQGNFHQAALVYSDS